MSYPTITLYEDDGSTPVYTFENVLDLPDQDVDNPSYVELSNLRSQGSINISGGDKSYPFRILGVITSTDYSSLRTAMKAMKTAITNNTNFVLKVVNSITDTDSYNVIRKAKIDFTGPARKTKIQYYTVEFLANSWS